MISSLGIAAVAVDCRGQSGKTGNCAGYSSGNEQSVVTLGLLNKDEYYYRHVYMDAVKTGAHGSFLNVTEYLKKHPFETDRVLETLSYFDIMNMAEKIRCPVLASVGLRDTICPALFFFAAYNRIPGEKQVEIYPFNNHEGGGGFHNELKMNYLAK